MSEDEDTKIQYDDDRRDNQADAIKQKAIRPLRGIPAKYASLFV